MPAKVLVVDDNEEHIHVACHILSQDGHSVRGARSGTAALEMLNHESSDVVLSDVNMPEMDGLALLEEIRSRWVRQPVVMMSGLESVEVAVEAMRRGAADFVPKPLEFGRLRNAISVALSPSQTEPTLNPYVSRDEHELVGESQAMLNLKRLVEQVGATDCRVLIQGESGTGKELIANALHRVSARRDRPFIKINCGALTSTLLESELFGHERGAFTGALTRRRGRFEIAHMGTLLLDEVGELSMEAQVRLLRVIQEGEFERVGGSQTLRCDVRIFAASNKDLAQMVARGQFREDLYYRLNVVVLLAPPLRSRRTDIPLLVHHQLDRLPPESRPVIPDETMSLLSQCSFPGNVRELQNFVERLSVLMPQEVVTAKILTEMTCAKDGAHQSHPSTERVYRPGVSYRDRLLQLERRLILDSLEHHAGNRIAAAESLGTDKSFLYRKCRQFGI